MLFFFTSYDFKVNKRSIKELKLWRYLKINNFYLSCFKMLHFFNKINLKFLIKLIWFNIITKPITS